MNNERYVNMKLQKLQELLKLSEEEVKNLVIEAVDNDFSSFSKVQDQINQLNYYQQELKQQQKNMEELKKSNNTEALQKKIEQMQLDYENRESQHKLEMKNLRFDTLLEKEVLKVKPKNVEAVKYLLHLDSSKYNEKENTIYGLKEKLQALMQSDGYLFDTTTSEAPKIEGIQPVSSNISREGVMSGEQNFMTKKQSQWTYQDWDAYYKSKNQNV